jgi:hypothetical protein
MHVELQLNTTYTVMHSIFICSSGFYLISMILSQKKTAQKHRKKLGDFQKIIARIQQHKTKLGHTSALLLLVGFLLFGDGVINRLRLAEDLGALSSLPLLLLFLQLVRIRRPFRQQLQSRTVRVHCKPFQRPTATQSLINLRKEHNTAPATPRKYYLFAIWQLFKKNLHTALTAMKISQGICRPKRVRYIQKKNLPVAGGSSCSGPPRPRGPP